MIVALLSDTSLRAALLRAARPDEDVLWEADAALDALQRGYPRVVVHAVDEEHALAGSVEPLHRVGCVLALRESQLRAWAAERRQAGRAGQLVSSVEDTAARLEVLLREVSRPVWVDRAFRDLERAAGTPLPSALKGLGRRVMEHPARYGDLTPVAEMVGLSPGALKARFRRRDLPSPYGYLRWFRLLAGAHVLSDRSVTTGVAAHRLGFAGSGNLCRTAVNVTGLTPTELRDRSGWSRALMRFSVECLRPAHLAPWETLDELFLRTA